MADGLSIITGISMLVFLLFYLAFNINDKSKFMLIPKVFLIIFGLFLLSYIPGTMKTLDRDCAVLNNGSYRCYSSNGSQISNFSNYGTSTTQIGTGLVTSYFSFLYLTFAFVFISVLVLGGKWTIDWWKGRKLI